MKLPPDGAASGPNDSSAVAGAPADRKDPRNRRDPRNRKDPADRNHPADHDEPAPRRIDRKMLDDIFGDVLPDTTRDERGQESGSDGYSEQWYRDNRPPHHGG